MPGHKTKLIQVTAKIILACANNADPDQTEDLLSLIWVFIFSKIYSPRSTDFVCDRFCVMGVTRLDVQAHLSRHCARFSYFSLVLFYYDYKVQLQSAPQLLRFLAYVTITINALIVT